MWLCSVICTLKVIVGSVRLSSTAAEPCTRLISIFCVGTAAVTNVRLGNIRPICLALFYSRSSHVISIENSARTPCGYLLLFYAKNRSNEVYSLKIYMSIKSCVVLEKNSFCAFYRMSAVLNIVCKTRITLFNRILREHVYTWFLFPL